MSKQEEEDWSIWLKRNSDPGSFCPEPKGEREVKANGHDCDCGCINCDPGNYF